MVINKNVNNIAVELFQRYPDLIPVTDSFFRVYYTIEDAFCKDGTLFLCGNGGSAADCEHIVGELMKGFRSKRPVSSDVAEILNKHGGKGFSDQFQMGLRAISLLSHPALSSAYVNDVDPLMTYAQQLFVLGRKGDVLLGISTGGNSKNVLNTFKTARAKGITTILLTGISHGLCEEFADVVLNVPTKETFKIQELHLPVYHALCAMLEERFYGKE